MKQPVKKLLAAINQQLYGQLRKLSDDELKLVAGEVQFLHSLLSQELEIRRGHKN
jgi:hypothetical protein